MRARVPDPPILPASITHTKLRRCCCAQPGQGQVMGQVPESSSALSLSFTPSLVDNKYVPNTNYEVRITDSNGMVGSSQWMLGSTLGTWANPTCSKAGTTGSQGTSQSDVWTAPSSGTVTIGGSHGKGYGQVVFTMTVRFFGCLPAPA